MSDLESVCESLLPATYILQQLNHVCVSIFQVAFSWPLGHL
jgi:hypothetical protein